MAAPNDSFILAEPPPLSATAWPFHVEPAPWDEIFGAVGAYAPLPEMMPPDAN